MGLIQRLFTKADVPTPAYTQPFTKADVPTPAYTQPLTNWQIIKEAMAGYSNDVMADYQKLGNPLMTNDTVFTCVNKIANNISQVPFIIKDGKDEPVSYDNPIQKLFRYVNVNDNRFDLWNQMLMSLELTGKSYLILEGFVRGIPSYMWVANASLMETVLDKVGMVSHYLYGPESKQIRIEPEAVIFFRYTHPDNPYDGLSPITAARMNILFQWYAYRYQVNFFKKGAQVPGFLKKVSPRPLTKEQKEDLNKELAKTMHGESISHQIHIFSSDLDYVSLGTSQKDMEFINLISHSEERILNVFQVPKAVLGYTDTTFNNMAEAKKSFWTDNLMPKMKMIEEVLRTNFFDRFGLAYYGEFDTSGIPELQENMIEKAEVEFKLAQTAQIYILAGVPFQAINERLELGFEKIPEPEKEAVVEIEKSLDVEDIETVIKQYEQKKAIDREKALLTDRDLLDMEYGQVVKAMSGPEKELITKIKNFWKSQFKLVIGKLKQEKTEKGLSEDLIAFINSLDWETGFFDEVKGLVEDTYISGARRTFYGVGINFNINPARTLAYLAERQLKLSDSPVVVRDALIDGITQGSTSDEIAEAIKHNFNVAEGRAKAIARTETTAAYNGGRVDGMVELGIKRKAWVHSNDSTVRESHRISQTVGTKELFTLRDGEKVGYPGQGSASNAVNCRCTVISVLGDEDTEQLLNM
ncbi:MAG: phage portal protein [Candidatus Thorarchaeota archaeon]